MARKMVANKIKARTEKKIDKAGGRDWDFVGLVESVNVKGEGPNSVSCQFSLVDKSGAHRTWVVEPAEVPHRFIAMVSLLTAVAGSKVQVMLREGPGVPTPYAIELEIRPTKRKLRKKSKAG